MKTRKQQVMDGIGWGLVTSTVVIVYVTVLKFMELGLI